MKRLAILSMLIVIMISGCVERTDFKDGPPTNATDGTNVKTDAKSSISGASDANPATEIDIQNGTLQMTDKNSMSSGSGWCMPGDKMTASGEEFTISGTMTYEGRDNICMAEKVTQGGSSKVYYNEGYANNGSDQFFKMESTGKNAKASAIVTVGN